ncbi:MAG TPA: hypothetical protein PLC74_07355 [Acetobacteraceae bacterium]|nr:hypothetical protein [Acetobacteraceae bacterium]
MPCDRSQPAAGLTVKIIDPLHLPSAKIIQRSVNLYASLLKWGVATTGISLAYILIHLNDLKIVAKINTLPLLAKMSFLFLVTSSIFLLPVVFLSWSFMKFDKFDKILTDLTVIDGDVPCSARAAKFGSLLTRKKVMPTAYSVFFILIVIFAIIFFDSNVT